MYAKINMFEIVDGYLQLKEIYYNPRFFLQWDNKGTTDEKTFFKNQDLGRNTFMKLLTSICAEVGAIGKAVHECLKNHSLRDILITILVEGGHSIQDIIMRRIRLNEVNVWDYTRLNGEEVLNQQKYTFKEESPGKRNNS